MTAYYTEVMERKYTFELNYYALLKPRHYIARRGHYYS